jgi:hypothetical protein
MGYPVILVEICHLCDSDDGGGAILNDTLFSSEEVVVTKNNNSNKHRKVRSATDGDTTVQIDDTGIRIRKNKPGSGGKEIEIDENGIREKNGIAGDSSDTSNTCHRRQ